MNLIEALTTPAIFAPLIAGSLFLAIGITMLTHRIRLRTSANHTTGKVIAIEKYTSTSGTGSDRSKTTYYRPIVEYKYDNETRTVKGSSINEIRHKLSQNVPVLVKASEDGSQIQDAVDDPIDNVFSILMALTGLGALVVYIMVIGGSPAATLVCASTAIGIGHVISSAKLNFGAILIKESGAPEREDSTLITTKSEYIEEVSSHAFWGGIITVIAMIGALWITYAGYNDLPAEASHMMINNPDQFWIALTQTPLPGSWKKPLMLMGIGLFFFAATLHSVFYLRKKYGALIRV